MIDLFRDNQSTIAALCQQFGVSRLDVFGSAAWGDFDPDSSDLDFLIEFHEYGPSIASRYFRFIAAMEEQLGKKVDTIFGPNVKIPVLQDEIDKSREMVYESPSRKIAA